MINAAGLLIRIPVLKFVEPVMEKFCHLRFGSLPYLDAKTVGDNLTLAIAVIMVMFWNFFVNRYWTYSDVE